MPSIEPTNKKERLSFFVNPELSEKINSISKQTNLTISEIGRKALQNFIDLLEKEKLENELEAGYKANFQYYLKSQKEWENADFELYSLFHDPKFESVRMGYLENLNKVIRTEAFQYDLDEVLLCGGLADVVTSCDFTLEEKLTKLLSEMPKEMDHPVRLRVMKEGNLLPLIGALALAKGEAYTEKRRVVRTYQALESEIPYDGEIQLQNLSTEDIVETLCNAEQEA